MSTQGLKRSADAAEIDNASTSPGASANSDNSAGNGRPKRRAAIKALEAMENKVTPRQKQKLDNLFKKKAEKRQQSRRCVQSPGTT